MTARYLLFRCGAQKFRPFGTVFAAWFLITILAAWFVFDIAKAKNQAEAERQLAVAERNVATAALQKVERPVTSIPPK